MRLYQDRKLHLFECSAPKLATRSETTGGQNDNAEAEEEDGAFQTFRPFVELIELAARYEVRNRSRNIGIVAGRLYHFHLAPHLAHARRDAKLGDQRERQHDNNKHVGSREHAEPVIREIIQSQSTG